GLVHDEAIRPNRQDPALCPKWRFRGLDRRRQGRAHRGLPGTKSGRLRIRRRRRPRRVGLAERLSRRQRRRRRRPVVVGGIAHPCQMPLEGLNDEQLAAAQAVRGPVCILAGAGSGKTTTLTRRIANQIATGTFGAVDVLALTFTERAAGELKRRLKSFGDVRARTFHAEALAQVAHFGTRPELLPSKAMVISPIVRTLPRPYKFKATKDVAAEI